MTIWYEKYRLLIEETVAEYNYTHQNSMITIVYKEDKTPYYKNFKEKCILILFYHKKGLWCENVEDLRAGFSEYREYHSVAREIDKYYKVVNTKEDKVEGIDESWDIRKFNFLCIELAEKINDRSGTRRKEEEKKCNELKDFIDMIQFVGLNDRAIERRTISYINKKIRTLSEKGKKKLS